MLQARCLLGRAGVMSKYMILTARSAQLELGNWAKFYGEDNEDDESAFDELDSAVDSGSQKVQRESEKLYFHTSVTR